MSASKGITLIEILVVLVIVGIAAAFYLPNYTAPTEQARAATAQDNLLAIYGAEQNYNNNNGAYCTAAVCSSLASIDTAFTLSMQDDGTYSYSCSGVTCTATRTSISAPNTIVVTLNAPINLSGNVNPQCNLPNGWCH